MGRGTAYRIYDAPSGLGTAPVRASDTPYLSADGVFAAGDFHDARPVALGLVCMGSSPAEAEQLARTLAAAWQASRVDLDLSIRMADSRTYLLRGRPRKCEVDTKELKYGHARAACLFVATDPRLYDSESTDVVLPLGVGVVPGVTFPLTFPMVFGTSSPGVSTITNRGTVDTYPVITIAGEVGTPRLENITTGKTMELNLTMGVGDVAVIDMGAQTITYNGTNSLGALATGATFWPLIPGENQVSFRAPISSTVASATVSYRSAWL
jgi:hypothetical protein